MSETTTDRLAEIEGRATEYTPPEGWRVLQVGEVIQAGDRWVRPTDKQAFYALRIGEIVRDGTFIRRIEPEQIITPDDVAGEPLAGVWDAAQAEREIAELRSEVSHVQGLLGESSRRVVELETLVADLRAVNAATEKAVNSAARDKADLQHRLDTVAAEWALQAETIRGLQTQLEAVKAELVQASKDRYALQVELDAREQVPEAVSDRFDQGFEHGTARAVETIAEWLEPLRKLIDAADNFAETNLASNLASDTIQALPHIMRTLTGLADED